VDAEKHASQTALFAAAARAAHPLVDNRPHLLSDEVAQRLCRTASPSPLDYQLSQPGSPVLAAARLASCTRARFAEAVVSETQADQVLLLGAGLDTVANRRPAASPVSVWAADRPDVLSWRSRLFHEAGLNDRARCVPADLAAGLDLEDLEAAGMDLRRPVLALWLGVSMYLTPERCRDFIGELAALPAGSRVVVDYHLSPEHRDEAGRAYAQAVAAMAGHAGEPWQCSTAPGTVAGWFVGHGWRVELDVDEAAATPEGFFDRQEHLSPMRLVRLLHAVR